MNFTSFEVTGFPSWNLIPGFNLKTNFFPSFVISYFSAIEDSSSIFEFNFKRESYTRIFTYPSYCVFETNGLNFPSGETEIP